MKRINFSIHATVTLNYENIGKYPEIISKINFYIKIMIGKE